LSVVEDTTQAHGAMYRGKNRTAVAGSIGDAGCFSFHPTRNLGSMGEGGGITLNDPDLAAHIRMIRDHGQSDAYVHTVVGQNARMHAIQAAVLRIKLPHLASWNARRRQIAARYHAGIEGLPLSPVIAPSWSDSVYHQFVLRAENRDMWRSALGDGGIGTGIQYATPMHRQPAFAEYATTDPIPNCEQLANEIFSLPMYPELTDAEVDVVIAALQTAAVQVDAAQAA
jgi:dTDP-4-amino-4,6-dideoxygalactose transaminase